MEETRSYLGRGRRFERLSVEDLNKGWVAAFTSVCADGAAGIELRSPRDLSYCWGKPEGPD
jgi:hypothetical protein